MDLLHQRFREVRFSQQRPQVAWEEQSSRSFPTCPSRFSCRHSQRAVLVTLHPDGSTRIRWVIGTPYSSKVPRFPGFFACKLLGKVPRIFFREKRMPEQWWCPQVLWQLFLYSSSSQKQGEPGLQCVVDSAHFYNEFPTMEILQSVI